MVENLNIETVKNYETKEETLLVSMDMVLLITDVQVFKLLARNDNFVKKYMIDKDKYEYISDYAMEPKIFDRTIKNMIKWLRIKDHREDFTDNEYEDMYRQFRRTYAKEIYSMSEPTEFAKNIPILFTQSSLKNIYIMLDSDELIRKYQAEALVNILGPYAYRVKLVTPDKGESIVDVVKNDIPSITSIYYDDINVISEAKDKGLNLSNLCFGISDLSYNYELVEVPNDINEEFINKDSIDLDNETEQIALLKIDVDKISAEEGTGIGLIELKSFDDRDKYFALG